MAAATALTMEAVIAHGSGYYPNGGRGHYLCMAAAITLTMEAAIIYGNGPLFMSAAITLTMGSTISYGNDGRPARWLIYISTLLTFL